MELPANIDLTSSPGPLRYDTAVGKGSHFVQRLISLQGKMSAFEKLPREIRDLIYEYCLLYGGR